MLIDVFDSSAYTVSEDEGFVELTIVVNETAATTNNATNVTVHFFTSDGTAQG